MYGGWTHRTGNLLKSASFMRSVSSQVALVVKNRAADAGDVRDMGLFHPWVQKIPWSRKWQSIPVFVPGESHGQRSLKGYAP